MRLHLLVVEDEEPARTSLLTLLRSDGHDAVGCATLREAELFVSEAPFDCVLLDRTLPDGDGVDYALHHEWTARCDIVVVTGDATVDAAVFALRCGCSDYLVKPLLPDRLRATLANVERARRSGRERDPERVGRHDRLGRLVGRSAAMQPVYDQIVRVAPTNASVLLSGESGTGKELVAEAIHERSPRASGPLVAVNCGAIPEALIESELFGHDKGAFTGADRACKGVFERAHGGTLFLDEVTEMPPALQVKLLRALETRRVTPIGGHRAVDIDVRVIAATNRSPNEALDDGTLRADLFYRLAVFPIELPPLRCRDGDVALLAQHFLDELNAQHDTAKVFAADSWQRLEGRRWQGNVRELRNVVQRAFILADTVLHVPPPRPPSRPTLALTEPDCVALPAAWQHLTLKQVRDELVARAEQSFLAALLARHHGRIDQTAAAAGIGTRALYDAMHRHGLRKEDFRLHGADGVRGDAG